MFGNGKTNPMIDQQGEMIPPDTSSLWGNMFGANSLFKVITDPTLGAKSLEMMAAIQQGAMASVRIEQKLDMLLKALGHEIDAQGFATLPQSQRADGPGGAAVASGAADDGNRGIARPGVQPRTAAHRRWVGWEREDNDFPAEDQSEERPTRVGQEET
jgi:hypothetical protein